MESTLKNMVLTLLVITLVASAAVGLVYQATVEPIAAAKKAKTIAALKEVLPPFDNDPSAEAKVENVDGLPITIYTGTEGGKLSGYAIQTGTKNGFGGLITLMVGFKPDGQIVKIEALTHNETPGLGDKIDSKKSNFSVQFSGKNPASYKLAVKKDGGDVDAITASTISSRAYLDAVQRAYKVLQTVNNGGQNNE